jgi:hypothetical protein
VSNAISTKRMRWFAKWVTIGLLGIVSLYVLLVVIVLLGVVLGLWPMTDH